MNYSESIEKIKIYIKEHLTDELSAESIAHEAGYSVFHFCRIFKEETGMYNEIDIEEDAPSFQGYTFDYMDYVLDEELEEKTIAYIREHKELFIN